MTKEENVYNFQSDHALVVLGGSYKVIQDRESQIHWRRVITDWYHKRLFTDNLVSMLDAFPFPAIALWERNKTGVSSETIIPVAILKKHLEKLKASSEIAPTRIEEILGAMRSKEDIRITNDGFVVKVLPAHDVSKRQIVYYTVGLAGRGLPELVMLGNPAAARSIIYAAALSCMALGRVPEEFDHVEHILYRKVSTRPIDDLVPVLEHILVQATDRYSDVTALQLLWADDDRCLPTDVGYSQVRHPQPLL